MLSRNKALCGQPVLHEVITVTTVFDWGLWLGCRSKAQHMGRKLVSAMKDKLGKQLFEVVIQASANGDIVARETIKVRTGGTFGCD